MKNEQQSQNLLLKVDPGSTFRNNFLQPATNVFVAGQVDHARWKTGNIDQNSQRNSVARQVEGFCISYFAALSLEYSHTKCYIFAVIVVAQYDINTQIVITEIDPGLTEGYFILP